MLDADRELAILNWIDGVIIMRTALAVCLLIFILPQSAAQEVTVLPGYDEAIEWLESIEWWGEGLRGEQLQVPRTLLVGISPKWREVITEALYRLDVIPAGLVLGQGAYESGYGTSRFAAEGNALFGQWTFGGEGLAPSQQRKELGDHRIAAFEWPFDSVRGYFLNLSSHPAYEDFRRIRADLKTAGNPVTSLALADGLLRYSERGQEYVDQLKSIIRSNHFDVADNATPRDEPIGFAFAVAGEEAAGQARARIEELRNSGEFDETLARMRLE